MLRDKIMLYKDWSVLSSNCYSCNKSGHIFSQCPKILNQPFQDLYIKKYNYTKDQVRDKKRSKRKVERSKATHALASFKSINYTLSKYMYETQEIDPEANQPAQLYLNEVEIFY
jgi:hypothetical protein